MFTMGIFVGWVKKNCCASGFLRFVYNIFLTERDYLLKIYHIVSINS